MGLDDSIMFDELCRFSLEFLLLADEVPNVAFLEGAELGLVWSRKKRSSACLGTLRHCVLDVLLVLMLILRLGNSSVVSSML